MIFQQKGFNIYLALVVVMALLSGCSSTEGKRKKGLSTLRVHMEMIPDSMGRTETVQVYRAQPFLLTVAKQPFLTEAQVKLAKVTEVLGGYAIEIEFERQGAWLLEQYTAAARGKHLGLFSQWYVSPDEKLNEGRWIAAPLVQTHITDGILVFTPDASREEALQIVTGLNNVAKKAGNAP